MLSQVTYVYTFLSIYGSKLKIQMAESLFLTSGKLALNDPAVIYLKIQNRLGRAP